MNILHKYEKCRRWLKEGNTLTYRQAINHWSLYSFRRFLDREKLRPNGLEIENIGKPGSYGIYRLKTK